MRTAEQVAAFVPQLPTEPQAADELAYDALVAHVGRAWRAQEVRPRPSLNTDTGDLLQMTCPQMLPAQA